MNVVALTGRLVPAARPARPGWASAAIEVRRRQPADPGIVVVPLMIPPDLSRVVADELRDGDSVAVAGVLDVEDDLAAVVVQSIEPY